MTTPGARIELDGALNLRDLGGWATADGRTVRYGKAFRCDRLSDLSTNDHATLDSLNIKTVIDLRYEREVVEHPSALWGAVTNHLEIPMGGGQLADQKSFIERAIDGEFEGITDADVGESYLSLLTDHAADFARVVTSTVTEGPSLFHCTAGKDRTGLTAMLILSTLGVSDEDIRTDFGLSNEYRAETRIAQLRDFFTERGLDVENFRPALSAPVPAMAQAQAWIEAEHGGAEGYLRTSGMSPDAIEQMRTDLLD